MTKVNNQKVGTKQAPTVKIAIDTNKAELKSSFDYLIADINLRLDQQEELIYEIGKLADKLRSGNPEKSEQYPDTSTSNNHFDNICNIYSHIDKNTSILNNIYNHLKDTI